MKLGTTTYNERSWAIDLIGHLKHLATQNNKPIKDAGECGKGALTNRR